MSKSRRQGNTILISVAVLLLFVVSTLVAGPAAGSIRSEEFTTSTVGDFPDGPGGLTGSSPDDREWEFVARPISPTKGLTSGGRTVKGFSNSCFIDFNEPNILLSLPNHAIDSFVEWPFWNQYCPQHSDTAVAVEPVGASHYHLGYVDETLRWCFDLETFGRPIDPEDPVSDCDPIDPLTEPRSGIQPHYENYSIRILAHDLSTDERVNFDLNQIRILSGQAEICFVKTGLPWITAKPTDDPPGYCGDLEPGNWDVSASVIDAYEVRIYARSPNMSFTDIGLSTG